MASKADPVLSTYCSDYVERRRLEKDACLETAVYVGMCTHNGGIR